MARSDKFDAATKNARARSGVGEVENEDFDPTQDLLQPIDMRGFAEAVKAGAKLGERFLEMGENQQIAVFYLGTSEGFIEEMDEKKNVVRKPVSRIHFEVARELRLEGGAFEFRPTGIVVSMLEYAQLKSQIVDVLPPDGSCVVKIGKLDMGRTKRRGRQIQNFVVARFEQVRAPRMRIAASSGITVNEETPAS